MLCVSERQPSTTTFYAIARPRPTSILGETLLRAESLPKCKYAYLYCHEFAGSAYSEAMNRPSRIAAGRDVWIAVRLLDGFRCGDLARAGISRYLLSRPHLQVRDLPDEEEDVFLRRLRRERPAGCLTAFTSRRIVQALRRARVPAVLLMHPPPAVCAARVCTDEARQGRLVAEYFAGLGLRRFAFVGLSDYVVTGFRQRSFIEAARALGREVSVHTAPHGFGAMAEEDIGDEATARWLRALPKPIGLLAVADPVGRRVAEYCARLGIAVPEDVAIVGVNNMALVCATTKPPLSSVALDYERIGYEGAALLDRLREGRARADTQVLIPPQGIVTRQSSDVLAIADPDVVRVLKYIREHADRPLTVRQVLQAVPMARRSIEEKFRRYLGHSPWKEIKRIRIARVKRLLESNDWPIARVAEACHYPDGRALLLDFRKQTGLSPRRYRRQFRPK